jgi:hypothetical protein
MATHKKLVPKRDRLISPALTAQEFSKGWLGDSEIQDLLREVHEDQERQRRRGLSKAQMYENAIHESGHAVLAGCLGIGPLTSGIKLWPHGNREKGQQDTRWGMTQLCHWTESDGPVRDEMERSIVSLFAGREAQNRLTEVFARDGWNALPAEYVLSIELDGASRDDRMVRNLLSKIPLHLEESQASLYNSLLDRTRRLLDENWPAVVSVARAVLRTKHYSLGGKAITRIVNRTMGTRYRVIRTCIHL